MQLTTQKFIGKTSECFRDLVARNTDLRLFELMAAFCGVDLMTVLRWRQGGEPMGGEAMLKLRVLLHLAGYEVEELHALNKRARDFAMVVGLGILEPQLARETLGYQSTSLQSLWRVLVPTRGADSGFSDTIGNNMVKIARKYRAEVQAKSAETRQVLERIMPAETPQAAAHQPSTTVDTALAAAFGQSVDTVSALIRTLRTQEQRAAALDATRGGYTIRELIQGLQSFLPPV